MDCKVTPEFIAGLFLEQKTYKDVKAILQDMFPGERGFSTISIKTFLSKIWYFTTCTTKSSPRNGFAVCWRGNWSFINNSLSQFIFTFICLFYYSFFINFFWWFPNGLCSTNLVLRFKLNRNNTNLPYQYFRIEVLKRLHEVNVRNLQFWKFLPTQTFVKTPKICQLVNIFLAIASQVKKINTTKLNWQ